MRGAGCTYNDIVDRDLDMKVERTRERPLPSGEVSVTGAVIFLVLLAVVGLAVLFQFNFFAIVTGFASLGIVALYPFMKRFFWMPQIVLGLAFAWGALMGWAAAFGSLAAPAFLLYAGSIAWVVGTTPSTRFRISKTTRSSASSRRHGFSASRSGSASEICYALTILFLTAAFYLAGAGWPGFVGLGLFALTLAGKSRGSTALMAQAHFVSSDRTAMPVCFFSRPLLWIAFCGSIKPRALGFGDIPLLQAAGPAAGQKSRATRIPAPPLR